ncbi:NACHT domain-containing protein [Pseudomonadota bacterium]
MLNKHSDGRLSTFQDKITNFVENSSSSNKAELQKWQQNGIAKDANTALKRILYVRTILSTREEINLLDFYYPSTFSYEKNNLSIDDIMQCNSNKPSLIVGTVGQGKSIALRYLSFFTLCRSSSIPIFLELRKLRTSTTLFEHIRQFLIKIRLDCSEKLLRHLLSSGYITLLLDGFDEIKHENRTVWVEEIEELHTRFTQFKIFVTTRPNTDIHHRNLFQNFELSQLNESDRPRFIKKLIKNKDDQTALITKLSKASNGVIDLLVTPLLMTFFVNTYQGRRKLPNSNSEFFDELFSTILSRHDGLKAAYDRPSKCGFTDKELKSSIACIPNKKS